MFVFHLFSFFSDYVAALFYAAFAGSQSPLGVHRWLGAELVVLLWPHLLMTSEVWLQFCGNFGLLWLCWVVICLLSRCHRLYIRFHFMRVVTRWDELLLIMRVVDSSALHIWVILYAHFFVWCLVFFVNIYGWILSAIVIFRQVAVIFFALVTYAVLRGNWRAQNWYADKGSRPRFQRTSISMVVDRVQILSFVLHVWFINFFPLLSQSWHRTARITRVLRYADFVRHPKPRILSLPGRLVPFKLFTRLLLLLLPFSRSSLFASRHCCLLNFILFEHLFRLIFYYFRRLFFQYLRFLVAQRLLARLAQKHVSIPLWFISILGGQNRWDIRHSHHHIGLNVLKHRLIICSLHLLDGGHWRGLIYYHGFLLWHVFYGWERGRFTEF